MREIAGKTGGFLFSKHFCRPPSFAYNSFRRASLRGMAGTGSGSEESSPNRPLSAQRIRPAVFFNPTLPMEALSPALSPEMESDSAPESAARSSVSLARKWRPRNFADIVGQDYVVDAVRRAARRHHAYLFSGTRGVGKTTLARVLAMLLNCQDENAEDPCGKCPNCRDIAAGKFTAVMELDAASLKSGSGDTQVGQIRELMDEMAYAPAQGRFRVLIMDEVHALGAGPKAAAFNPLLKTLEEPPPHARFILATTDPQRLPATVRSRCLCFSLSPIPRGVIAERLAMILQEENIPFEDDAVAEIARLGRGSLRDALSILDQVAHSGETLAAARVRRIVGASSVPILADILRAVANGSPADAMKSAAALAAQNADFSESLQQMSALIFRAAARLAIPQSADNDDGEEEAAAREISEKFSPEELQALYEIAVRGRAQIPFAPDERSGFEMTLLRMSLFSPAPAHPAPTPASASASAPPVQSAPPAGAVQAQGGAAAKEPPASRELEAIDPAKARALSWEELTRRVSETGRALAIHCREVSRDANGITVALDYSRRASRMFEGALTAELQNLCGENFALRLEVGEDDPVAESRARAAQASADSDAFVRSVCEKMPGATVAVKPSESNGLGGGGE